MAITTTKRSIRGLSTPDNVAPNVETKQIAASQGVFIPGAPCYNDTSGTVTLATTGATTSDPWHGFIVGARDSSAWPVTTEYAVNTKIRVEKISLEKLYVVQIQDDGSDASSAQAYVGNDYGLVVESGAGVIGYTTMDVNDTTNVAVHVVDIMPNREPSKFANTDDIGYAIVQFLAATQLPA